MLKLKKHRKLLALLILHFIVITSNAQSSLTFKAGLSISKFKKTSTNLKPWNEPVSTLTGPAFGAIYQVPLKSKMLTGDVGLFLNTRGGKSNLFTKENFWIAYLQLPIGLSFNPFKSSTKWSCSFSTAFVLSLDIATSQGMFKGNNFEESRLRYHDIEAWVGGSVYKGRWGLTIQYCHGLKTISSFENFYSLKNRAVNLMLAYKIGKYK